MIPETEAYDSNCVHIWGHVILSWNLNRTVGLSNRESDTDLHWNCMRFNVARLAFTCW